MKSKKIQINSREYTIKEVPLRTLVDSLEIIKRMPDTVADIDMKDNQVKVVTELVTKSANEFFDLLAKLSGIEAETIGGLGLADVIKLVRVMLEVNEFSTIKKEFGEIGVMFQDQKKPEAK